MAESDFTVVGMNLWVVVYATYVDMPNILIYVVIVRSGLSMG